MNITPDHLDRYDFKMQNYINSKFRITRNMSENDCFIFCEDDDITIGHLSEIVLRAKKFPFSQTHVVEQGAFLQDNQICVRTEDDEYGLPVEDLSLSGKHNLYNTMAAAITAKIMNISNETIRESLKTFQGVEHRLEKVLSIRDIQFINDSKATNVNSAWYALESMTRPTVWIAGGKDKGNDYEPLTDLVKEKVRALVCLGKDNTKLHDFFGDKIATIVDASSAEEAVQKAYELAEPGDVVLLSPCCASFDLFKSYEDRGRQFKDAVRKL
jgi:UDP-N-acetylmuramoylalanine--D-glutamate ligase